MALWSSPGAVPPRTPNSDTHYGPRASSVGLLYSHWWRIKPAGITGRLCPHILVVEVRILESVVLGATMLERTSFAVSFAS